MKKEPKFLWEDEFGFASCTIDYNGNLFYGDAMCHDDDMDMKSEKTGCNIAFARARIKYLCFIRDNEVKPQLKALNELYNDMKFSTHFNPKSYEAKSLFRVRKNKQEDLENIKAMIKQEKEDLANMIKEKDEFYKRIRKNRSKEEKDIEIEHKENID